VSAEPRTRPFKERTGREVSCGASAPGLPTAATSPPRTARRPHGRSRRRRRLRAPARPHSRWRAPRRRSISGCRSRESLPPSNRSRRPVSNASSATPGGRLRAQRPDFPLLTWVSPGSPGPSGRRITRSGAALGACRGLDPEARAVEAPPDAGRVAVCVQSDLGVFGRRSSVMVTAASRLVHGFAAKAAAERLLPWPGSSRIENDVAQVALARLAPEEVNDVLALAPGQRTRARVGGRLLGFGRCQAVE
jgi:hypothetical protein